MKGQLSGKWWIIATGLLLLAVLSSGLVFAQNEGTITVLACADRNADGDCDDPEDEAPPADLEACLNDDTNCLPVPATFTDLASGSYTPFLRFVGASQGYYPTTPQSAIGLAENGTEEVTLGAVYPVHPKGVAVHEGLNKVYVAFQGPVELPQVAAAGSEASKPYPFVAVIDGTTDEVLRTIPGGSDGIGRSPWGVAVSGDNVYVGSFNEGRVSVIDANTDIIIVNLEPARDDFKPTSPAVNPLTNWVHFPDYQGGRVVIINGTEILAEPQIANQFGFSPFEMVVAKSMQGYNFVTMRDAIVENLTDPTPFKLRGLNSAEPFDLDEVALILPEGSAPRPSGSPHAIGLWQEESESEPRFFVTYAEDTRTVPNPPDFINPNKLLVYSFSVVEPKNILLRNANIEVGDFAEVGLVYNPDTDHMLGTYAGFAYVDDNGDEAACGDAARGGTYAVNFDGGMLSGDAPGVWKQPSVVIGNPPLVSDNLQWKNPFELAVNPNNGKVYVTDRCWNEFPEGGQPGGGAVLIFADSATEPELGPGSIVLTFDGPAAVEGNENFSVDVVALDVPSPGLYGVQFEVNYDPALIAVSNLQVNSDLSFGVIDEIDNVAGKITLVASRQGNVPGLTGDVTLLTFDATAADTSADATFTFENEIIGDASATAFEVTSESYTVVIGDVVPEPTVEPTTEPTIEPTAEPTTEPTAEPTVEPTAEPTTEPTAEPTTEPTAEPTVEPTAEPTEEPIVVIILGQVVLPGRSGNDWSDASVSVEGSGQSSTTDAAGNFSIANVLADTYPSITADAPGYLPSVCSDAAVSAPETALASVTLLSGDINDDDVVDIEDATAIGASFGMTGPDLPGDINRDGEIDILDIILVSVNFGQGAQTWDCIAD